MARKVLRVVVPGLTSGRQTLAASAARYIRDVHRLRRGDQFLAIDPERRLEAMAVIDGMRGGEVDCTLELPKERPTELGLPEFSLLFALSRGDKVERVLDSACQLGCERVVLVATERSVVRLSVERARARRERWLTVLREAARQSDASRLPELVGPLTLAQLLASARAAAPTDECAAGPAIEQAELRQESALRLLLDPRAEASFGELVNGCGAAKIELLVGPEGGLSEAEVEACALAGYRAVHFGSWVLRSETAAIAALGVLAALRGR